MSRRELPLYPVGQGVPGDIVPTREGYDRWSEVYDGDGNPLIALEEPQVERMLGDVRGLRIADVATRTVAIRFGSRTPARRSPDSIFREGCSQRRAPSRERIALLS